MNTLAPHQASFDAKCSRTAHGVAYRRTFTGIPHSEQIFGFLEEIDGPLDQRDKARADGQSLAIPFFESRYLLTDRILSEIGATHILELASGLSPRGYIWGLDQHKYCVELDLPQNIALKDQIVDKLRRLSVVRPPLNLTLVPGDVKNPGDFELACGYLEKEGGEAPISFVCEGLLRYLNWPDKETLAALIRRRISKNGGYWITPDLEFLSDANATAESRARYDAIAEEWDMDVRPNLFEDMDHALSFFRELGFTVGCRPHSEMLGQLQSPARLGLPPDAVRADLAKRFTFVMSA